MTSHATPSLRFLTVMTKAVQKCCELIAYRVYLNVTYHHKLNCRLVVRSTADIKVHTKFLDLK